MEASSVRPAQLTDCRQRRPEIRRAAVNVLVPRAVGAECVLHDPPGMATAIPDITASGLYLAFEDGTRLPLTFQGVEERSRRVLDDCEKVPPAVLEAEAFQLCTICPKRGSGDTCHAIRPILAVFECVDAYSSHAPVTAAYCDAHGDRRLTITTETTLQRALQYVSLLSVLYHCELGKTYWPYFEGVHPLMSVEDMVIRVYLNMFWACGGDRAGVKGLVERFHREITITTCCQMARLRLICHSDALLNALILTQIASEFLIDNIEELIVARQRQFGQSYFG